MKMVKPSKQSSRRHTTICQMRGKSLDSGYDPQGKLFPPFMLWDFPRPLVVCRFYPKFAPDVHVHLFSSLVALHGPLRQQIRFHTKNLTQQR